MYQEAHDQPTRASGRRTSFEFDTQSGAQSSRHLASKIALSHPLCWDQSPTSATLCSERASITRLLYWRCTTPLLQYYRRPNCHGMALRCAELGVPSLTVLGVVSTSLDHPTARTRHQAPCICGLVSTFRRQLKSTFRVNAVHGNTLSANPVIARFPARSIASLATRLYPRGTV